jgi:pyruvate formate lyase activating enzyme
LQHPLGERVRFGGIQGTTLIDFPDRVATVLFTVGCNLRCPYCHNWRLVINHEGPCLSGNDAIQFLESRKRFVDSVVITGGEPTIQEDLPSFIRELDKRGFKTKLDTNGFYPDILEKCLPSLDYVALDVKTSPERYRFLGASDIKGLQRTIILLKRGEVDYEFRNTTVPTIVDEQSIMEMGELVRGARRFVFQQFVPGDTLDKTLNLKPYSPKMISHFVDIMTQYVVDVKIRG